MNFEDALILANNSKNLIGKKINGAKIDEIIIHPSNGTQFQEYSKLYVATQNANKAVIPYLDSDLSVGVVLDKYRIRKDAVFFHTSIESAMNQHDDE